MYIFVKKGLKTKKWTFDREASGASGEGRRGIAIGATTDGAHCSARRQRSLQFGATGCVERKVRWGRRHAWRGRWVRRSLLLEVATHVERKVGAAERVDRKVGATRTRRGSEGEGAKRFRLRGKRK